MRSNVFVGIKGHDLMKTKDYEDKYDYLLAPITNSRYRESVRSQYADYKAGRTSALEITAPQLQDLGVPTSTLSANGVAYIGLIASWLELESEDPEIGELSFQVLKYEFEYARCFGIKQLILAPPRNLNKLNLYAQKIARLLSLMTMNDSSSSLPLLSISLPFFEDTDPLSTWELWNTIRKLCKYHASLTITLAIPRYKTPNYVLERWLSEPVSCLLVSSSIFATNQYNYPVLNKFNQELITKFQSINGNAESMLGELTIILHGMEKHVDKVRGGETIYLEYTNYLLKKGDKAIASKFAPGLPFDVPRIMPLLEPHSTQLTNQTYQTFEKDTTKYDLYEMAISSALQQLAAEMAKGWKRQTLNILIAGAGRGPLVDRTFQCLHKLRITNFKVVALEKNPQALLYLQKKNFENWDQSVEVVCADMRRWKSNIKIDLCISELLGSFGCNELSPECLMPIEENYCTAKTLYIPQSYSSYIAPVSSPLMYQSLQKRGDSALESPWVAHKIPYSLLSSKINELWTFNHPNDVPTNNRSVITHFKVKHRSEVHGFMGFFTAKLFGNIELSILPDGSTIKLQEDTSASTEKEANIYKKYNHTSNMDSWSPVFFPLRTPTFIGDDTEVELLFTRNCTGQKMWYEWSFNSFVYIVVPDESKYMSTRYSNSRGSHFNHRLDSRQSEASGQGKRDNGIQRHFTNFQPSPHVGSNSEGEDASGSANELVEDQEMESNEMYERTCTGESDFALPELNGWKSIRDIHNLGNPGTSFFDEGTNLMEHKDYKDLSHYEECHVRIRTNVSEIHNMGGQAHSVKL